MLAYIDYILNVHNIHPTCLSGPFILLSKVGVSYHLLEHELAFVTSSITRMWQKILYELHFLFHDGWMYLGACWQAEG